MSNIRLLGAAQLFVFTASVVSEQLLKSVAGSGGITEIMVNIPANLSRVRISNLIALANCLGVITLGVMFYIVLNVQNKTLALVALGCFLAEAITLAMSKIGVFALDPLSPDFVAAGSPEPSNYQTLGDFLYNGFDRRGYDIHMLFFCMGGILWYTLLHISGGVPAVISIWSLAAICLLTIPTLLVLIDYKFLPRDGLGPSLCSVRTRIRVMADHKRLQLIWCLIASGSAVMGKV
jgi:hypothetical protein